VNDSIVAEVSGVIERIFMLDPNTVGATTSQDDVKKWDSMGHLLVTMELESHFGLSIPPEVAETLVSVNKIAEYVASSR